MGLITGTEGDDSLPGTSGNDTIDALDGDDTVDGGFGNDTLLGGAGIDRLDGGLGDDLIDGGEGFTMGLGGAGNDTFVCGAGDYGGDEGDDRFLVGNSDMQIIGNDGLDEASLVGATAGVYGGINGSTALTWSAGGGNVRGYAIEIWWLTDFDDDIHAEGDVAVQLHGLGGNDTLYGWSTPDDLLDGGDGDDTLLAGGGNDTVVGGEGRDLVRFDALTAITGSLADGFTFDGHHVTTLGVERVVGSNHDDDLLGDDGDNGLYGADGADTLDGGIGNDTLDGGYDDDLLRVGSAGVHVVEGSLGRDTLDLSQLAAGVTVGGSAPWSLVASADGGFQLSATGVEILRATDHDDRIDLSAVPPFLSDLPYAGWLIDGGAGDDEIDGTRGQDTLLASAGNDTLRGGGGFDTASFAPLAGAVLVDLAAGSATAAGQTFVLAGIRDVLGSGFDDTLRGFEAAFEQLRGGAGDDTLEGRGGDDRLFGDDGDDAIDGGAGSDMLFGGAGADTLSGGAAGDTGIDLLRFETETVAVAVDLAAGIASTGDIFDGIEGVHGGIADDLLQGDAGANHLVGWIGDDTLEGRAGDDTLVGGSGADLLVGGDGNDLYVIAFEGGVAVEAGALGGTDTLRSGVSATLAGFIENLELMDDGGLYYDTPLTGTGNALANRITGNLGNNTLDGGAGVDTLVGGDGNDTYLVDATGDVVVETSTLPAAVDGVRSTASFTLSANVEYLTLLTGALNGNGNASNNLLVGNAAANTLDGRGGADTMSGGSGADTYLVDSPFDRIGESSSADRDTIRSVVTFSLVDTDGSGSAGGRVENLMLIGSQAIAGAGNALANALTGNAAANTLNGGAGNDTLDGGAGGDSLVGGTGADSYFVDSASDRISEASTLATEVDTVTSRVTWNLGANLEKLVLAGSSVISATGNGLANTLTGNGAANTLDGKAGKDVLTGGLGADSFRFSSTLNATTNVDRIADFKAVDDRLQLDDAVFKGIGAVGALASSAFVAGTKALDAGDRIVYNKTTGQLYFDADGSGAGAAVLFATATAGTALTAADVFIV